MIRNASSQAVGRARRSRVTEAGRAARASAGVTLPEEELDIVGLPPQADQLALDKIFPDADVLRLLGHDRLAIGKAAVKLHDVAQVLQEDERGEDLIRSLRKRATTGDHWFGGDAAGTHRRVDVLADGN